MFRIYERPNKYVVFYFTVFRSSLEIYLGFHGMEYFTKYICLTNFVISSQTPCMLITDPIWGNSGFRVVVKLLNFCLPLNVMVTFYIFACKQQNQNFTRISQWLECEIWCLVDF